MAQCKSQGLKLLPGQVLAVFPPLSFFTSIRYAFCVSYYKNCFIKFGLGVGVCTLGHMD